VSGQGDDYAGTVELTTACRTGRHQLCGGYQCPCRCHLTPSEPELSARITVLSAEVMRWVLYRLATGGDAVRADLAACLDAADRRARADA
jgi:hypothetical protein